MNPFIQTVVATLFVIAGAGFIVAMLLNSIHFLRHAESGRERSFFIKFSLAVLIIGLVFIAGIIFIPEPYNALVLICFLAFFFFARRYREQALMRIRQETPAEK